jgi:hypothetical protein
VRRRRRRRRAAGPVGRAEGAAGEGGRIDRKEEKWP